MHIRRQTEQQSSTEKWELAARLAHFPITHFCTPASPPWGPSAQFLRVREAMGLLLTVHSQMLTPQSLRVCSLRSIASGTCLCLRECPAYYLFTCKPSNSAQVRFYWCCVAKDIHTAQEEATTHTLHTWFQAEGASSAFVPPPPPWGWWPF